MQKYIDFCSAEGQNHKNTGTKGEVFLGRPVKFFLAKDKDLSIADFKTEAGVLAMIKAKDIVPFYDIETPENANTEPTYIQSNSNKELSEKGIKIKRFRHELGVCSYGALKSFNSSSVYTKYIEITLKGYAKGVATSDTTFKGESIKSFIVEDRVDATRDALEHCFVEIVFKDADEFVNNPAIIKGDFFDDVKGIFDINMEVASTNATEITFKALSGCCSDGLETLTLADIEVLDESGNDQTLTALSFANGVYTLTGTGLASGTIATNGVFQDTEGLYESGKTSFTI